MSYNRGVPVAISYIRDKRYKERYFLLYCYINKYHDKKEWYWNTKRDLHVDHNEELIKLISFNIAEREGLLWLKNIRKGKIVSPEVKKTLCKSVGDMVNKLLLGV